MGGFVLVQFFQVSFKFVFHKKQPYYYGLNGVSAIDANYKIYECI